MLVSAEPERRTPPLGRREAETGMYKRHFRKSVCAEKECRSWRVEVLKLRICLSQLPVNKAVPEEERVRQVTGAV